MKFVCKLLFLVGFFAWVGMKDCLPRGRGEVYVVGAHEDAELRKAKNVAFDWLINARKTLQDQAESLLEDMRERGASDLDAVKRAYDKSINFFSTQHIHMLNNFRTIAEIEKFLGECVAVFQERKAFFDDVGADDASSKTASESPASPSPLIDPADDGEMGGMSRDEAEVVKAINGAVMLSFSDKINRENLVTRITTTGFAAASLKRLPSEKNPRIKHEIGQLENGAILNIIMRLKPGTWFTDGRAIILKLQTLLAD
jgi:hypothetical protein